MECLLRRPASSPRRSPQTPKHLPRQDGAGAARTIAGPGASVAFERAGSPRRDVDVHRPADLHLPRGAVLDGTTRKRPEPRSDPYRAGRPTRRLGGGLLLGPLSFPPVLPLVAVSGRAA